jgi:phosphoglycolate phosphatase
MDRLILFDIDDTLTRGHGHPDAFAHAFRVVYGIEAEQPEGTLGMTDQQIIMKALAGKGLERQRIMDSIKPCMEEMARYYEESIPGRNVEVFEGVTELLSELEQRKILLGLVTGNVERIARAKLERAGIGHHFRVGGFGSDDPERSNLVRLAIRRAESMGFRPSDNVIVVGDTTRDIMAGRAAGVKTIGVATGPNSLEELEGAGADFLLENLKDRKRFLEIVG